MAAHIPPGFFERWIGPPFFNPGQNDRYIQVSLQSFIFIRNCLKWPFFFQLIHQYGDVILTHVYGHTHTDSFRIFADDQSK